MSAKRILEKYSEQRNTLPAAIDVALKNVTKNIVKPKVTMRIEVE